MLGVGDHNHQKLMLTFSYLHLDNCINNQYFDCHSHEKNDYTHPGRTF